MQLYWNPPAIVADGDRLTISVQLHAHLGGIAVDGLIDGVVDNFPDEMVQSGFPCATQCTFLGAFVPGQAASSMVIFSAV